ncbi:MAG TPA: pyridoxamine 5'-phosphate oxidase family protein [Pseudolysinimonas sp.]|nr:pyridoxamine 5'-phosphate oxidase family protein [Pseudolysinimonas sp.]
MTRPTADIEELDAQTCQRLLRTHNLGCLALVVADRVGIYPVNYLVFDDDVFFRTAPGSKLDALADTAEVAFEVDGRDRRTVWSVVVHGTARPVADEELVQISRISRMPTDVPGKRTHYVQIEATEVTGRTFSGAPQPWNARPILITGAVVVVVVAALGILGEVFHIG